MAKSPAGVPSRARQQAVLQSVKSPGRLIALEGISGAGLRKGGPALLSHLGAPRGRAGCSFWDASGAFFELSHVSSRKDQPSVKTLLILYATDLAFRLRWEIEPAVAEGYTVVAAPYVHTAIALGLAAHIKRDWLDNLFEFAPRPQAAFSLVEPPKPSYWHPKRLAGFVDYGCATLADLTPDASPADIHDRICRWLASQERSHRLRRFEAD